MGHGDEHRAEAAIRPGDVGLDAAAQARAVAALDLARHQPRSRDAAVMAQLFSERPEGDLGAPGKAVQILGQRVLIEPDGEDRLGPALGQGSALVVGRQQPEVAIELLGVKPLLAVTSENRLDGSVSALHRLKRRQRCVHPLLWQMVKQGVGFLSGRHVPNGSRGNGSQSSYAADSSEPM